jgi:hypothetical protein
LVLADALECFWNAALDVTHPYQDATANAVMGGMVQGFAAMAKRLRESAPTTPPVVSSPPSEGPICDDCDDLGFFESDVGEVSCHCPAGQRVERFIAARVAATCSPSPAEQGAREDFKVGDRVRAVFLPDSASVYVRDGDTGTVLKIDHDYLVRWDNPLRRGAGDNCDWYIDKKNTRLAAPLAAGRVGVAQAPPATAALVADLIRIRKIADREVHDEDADTIQRICDRHIPHFSDCAVHNEPAYERGDCTCGALDNADELAALPSGVVVDEAAAVERMYRTKLHPNDATNKTTLGDLLDYRDPRTSKKILRAALLAAFKGESHG